MAEISYGKIQKKPRHVPFVRNVKVRMTIGFALLILSVVLALTIVGEGRFEVVVSITAFAWIVAVFFTDKYVHKYPQRYFTYLIASHLKATIIMGFFLWIMGMFAGPIAAPSNVLWTGYVFFVFFDALSSVPCRRENLSHKSADVRASPEIKDIADDRFSNLTSADKKLSSIDKQTILNKIRFDLDKRIVEFIENNLPDIQGGNGDVLVLDDITEMDNQDTLISLLIGRTRINHVHRLNRFMQFCTERIAMRGYYVLRYVPLEDFISSFKDRYPEHLYWLVYTLHFLWYRAIPKIPWLDRFYFSPIFSWLDTIHLSVVKKRNRVLSKAEVSGRLAFYGMDVIAESKMNGEAYVLAQRVSLPVQTKSPSYYPIIALEKVGLDGEIISMHKIRTMFPFSEFIQQRIFEDHGLASTGKFSDDFRLTGVGKFLRKYWLDELPQIFDWLRGDIKLVGMRATSRHFLSLYPKYFLDLYVQVKPGLIPPIFDESTNGFDQIVGIEFTYLRRYLDQPFLTDVRYLIQTFTDIVFRGIRSK